MTFNPTVPLNNDSPAIFPAQNQANMSRLQTLLGADHQFNLSAAADDGYHNLVHLTPQAPSGALPGIGRVYVKSSGGVIQLFYMDDAGVEQQITPFDLVLPVRVIGSQSITAGNSVIILNVSYNFAGFGIALINGTNIQRTYNFSRSGAGVDIHEIDSNDGGISRPTIQFSGTTLTVTNQDSSTRTVVWSLIYNRI